MTDSYIYYPEVLTGEMLDIFLSKGWYRMGQGIFTTQHLIQEDSIYRVYWLRYDLERIVLGKTQQKIINQNRGFHTAIVPLEITEELESLFELYKTAINFDPAASVQQWLYAEQSLTVFDTELVEVRDRGKLIAAGIFDRGADSFSGIMNFYHPDYRKQSLGKYLMLKKIEQALRERKRWYYPGYIVYGYPKFDYKLFADKNAAEIYIPEVNEWHPYDPVLLDALESNETDE